MSGNGKRMGGKKASTTGEAPRHEVTERMRSLRRYAEAEPKVKADTGMTTNSDGQNGTVDGNGGSRDDCAMITQEAFQKLLEERKGMAKAMKREAEKRRLEGLRQIDNMNSKSMSLMGVNPLDRLPEEMWAYILEKLQPEDRGRMYQVYTVFRDLLAPSKIQNIVLPQTMEYKIPLLKKCLKNLLRLRSICKSFRDSIDAWIEQNILHAMRKPGDVRPHSHSFGGICFYISDSEAALKRMQAFSEGSEPAFPRRFVPRSLRIKLEVPTDSESSDFDSSDFWSDSESSDSEPEVEVEVQQNQRSFLEALAIFEENMSVLLERIGNQVLYFELVCGKVDEMERQGLSYTQIYIMFREWLQLMPNLKWISLQVKSGSRGKGQSRNLKLKITVDRGILETLTMPALEYLERVDLHMESVTHNGFSMCDPILIANPHVKIYNFYGDYHKFERYSNPAVLSTSLESARVAWDDCGLSMFQLEDISESSWKLKTLGLRLSAMNESIYNIFMCLERFPTLEDLSLRFNNVTIGDGGGGLQYLRLPNLKKFLFQFGHGLRTKDGSNFVFSLYFLVHCEKLESLIWYNDGLDVGRIRRKKDSLDETEGMLDFKCGLYDLSGSNVWDLFPRLKRIEVRFREKIEESRRYVHFQGKYENRQLVYASNKDWINRMWEKMAR